MVYPGETERPFGYGSDDMSADWDLAPDTTADILYRYPRIRLLSVMLFPSGHVLSWRGPRDQVDHTIWALSRGVTSGDRPVRGRTAGFAFATPFFGNLLVAPHALRAVAVAMLSIDRSILNTTRLTSHQVRRILPGS